MALRDTVPFQDRTDAGQKLAQRLTYYAGQPDLLVLGLPRGGVPVAAEVARVLRAPLDIFLAHKLPVPGQEELAMGAVTLWGETILSRDLIQAMGISQAAVDRTIREQRERLVKLEKLYRAKKPPLRLQGKTILLIDDGIATGSTIKAAIEAIRRQKPKRLIAAVPVAAEDALSVIHPTVDDLVALITTPDLESVGSWYNDFSQTTDDEVIRLLNEAAHETGPGC